MTNPYSKENCSPVKDMQGSMKSKQLMHELMSLTGFDENT